MNIKYLIHILLLLGHLVPAKAAAPVPHPPFPNEAETMGKFLCERIDLNRPGLESVSQEAQAGHYAAALEAWRDWKVRELRQINPGAYNWHGNQVSRKYLDFAEVLVGRMPPQQAARDTVWATFEDFYGLRGPVDQPLKTDWLAKDRAGKFSKNYRSFSIGNGLAVRYWQTGDPIYLQKWFQIAGDFARNQKRALEPLSESERREVPCNWLATDAAGMLAHGERVKVLVQSMGVLCKSLADNGKPATWAAVYQQVTASVPDASLRLVPAVELAQVALSLVLDHPAALLDRYEKPGAVPNQRLTGLSAVLLVATAFPEFKEAPSLLRKASSGIYDYLDGAFHADGGMLEQSFNYNFSSASDLELMAGWMRRSSPEFAAKLDQRSLAFRRLAASLASPLVRLPAMSSYPPMNPPPLWNDENARKKWFAEEIADKFATEDPLIGSIVSQFSQTASSTPPAFTSVAFPYTGYYAQRLNWRWDSPYLFLQASRRANGHSTMGCNSIQVVAFGRPLLVMAGPPVYTAQQLPEELRPDFSAINELLGSHSSLKTNTILVDGNSQNKAAPIAQTAPSAPIKTRWHASPWFDFAEGIYEDGYPLKNVTHHRQVIFVRKPGFWIVTDILVNNDQQEHRFSQVWNFPGRSEGKAFGFTEDQVVADSAAGLIHTADPDGPNLWLAHFGGPTLSYKKYFGAKNPYRGWFSPGIGRMIPAPQVMVNWKSSTPSVVATLLWPTPGNQPPDFKLHDTSIKSDSRQAGFAMALPDGTILHYTAASDARRVDLEGISTTAQALLTIKAPDGSVRGLILGPEGSDLKDAEFRWVGKEPKEVVPIRRTSGFAWRETAEGWQPEY
jgi:hypothetical protein